MTATLEAKIHTWPLLMVQLGSNRTEVSLCWGNSLGRPSGWKPKPPTRFEKPCYNATRLLRTEW